MVLKEATASHNLRGLDLISDIYMITGAAMGVAGFFLLFTISFTGLIAIGYGLLVVAVGYYLDNLRPAAWWFAVITGIVPLPFFLYYFIVAINITTGFTLILNLILAILVVGYLLKPNVRSLFM
ncbi:MAG: hypothetical protein ACFFCP_04870 [Promethearchaeota archaeon]